MPTVLTPTEVVEIRRDYANGAKRAALARKHCVSYQCIQDVVRGESWRETPVPQVESSPVGRRFYYQPANPHGLFFPKGSEWVTTEPFSGIARRPGVYVIYLDGKLTYVGQSENVLYRLFEHLRFDEEKKLWVSRWGVAQKALVKAKYTRRLGDWLMWEYRLIQRLRPIGNRAGLGIQTAVPAPACVPAA